MTLLTFPKLFAKPRSAEVVRPERKLRIGIPRVLNMWSTHRFWTTFFVELGVNRRSVVYSSETSEARQREFGQGRAAVDCCYPVKCMTGHYGELLHGLKKPINVLFSPKITTLPSILQGEVRNTMSCPRVLAGAESTKAGFLREGNAFADAGVIYVDPVVHLDEPKLAARELFEALDPVLEDLTPEEVEAAIEAGFAALEEFDTSLRKQSLNVLRNCAADSRPAVLALGRPYHMDPGIGHGIATELQEAGYPVLWGQYLPLEEDLLDWLYRDLLSAGRIRTPFDISDIWPSSHSSNTNELLWAARYASLMPWIACVIRFSSYECGMDQPTYTPVQETVEALGTLFFAFQDLDATNPAGSVRIRVETIDYYLKRRAQKIIEQKLAALDTPPESFSNLGSIKDAAQ
ncbi:acyl-CoA dehydratase activase-related protein [Actibacterium pelagium]|uniref:DUF2229 domain-containing protein n=1 Tax=Actibacterium pelagium TaxID=2029103 RepID=A0A917EJG0_9RHOB|nr:acyl-CoA dehydratase activase-related protein [Actibacterium pelagium]GGE50838.1 hypothetical protein GCM10011517_18250 [Actibacterium pelagium]